MVYRTPLSNRGRPWPRGGPNPSAPHRTPLEPRPQTHTFSGFPVDGRHDPRADDLTAMSILQILMSIVMLPEASAIGGYRCDRITITVRTSEPHQRIVSSTRRKSRSIRRLVPTTHPFAPMIARGSREEMRAKYLRNLYER
jgi:hypothetical protein